ncbi:MAG: hypothetical protein ACRD9R_09530 [Pyrinomonadaceae bacterium]
MSFVPRFFVRAIVAVLAFVIGLTMTALIGRVTPNPKVEKRVRVQVWTSDLDVPPPAPAAPRAPHCRADHASRYFGRYVEDETDVLAPPPVPPAPPRGALRPASPRSSH